MIRLATLSDIDTLVAIQAACHADVWSAEFIAELLGQAGCFAVLADPAEGFILIRAVAGEAEILTFGVISAARRRGLGVALLAAGAARAAALGAETIFLEVNVTNVPALALYAQMGFSEQGRRRGYYRDDKNNAQDALVLRAVLPLPEVKQPAPFRGGSKP